jgi:ornithine cyclodeaminase/alanine dehydrogenase-like protein (mu-crystallin family)
LPLLINAEETRDLLTMEECLSVLETAYTALAGGDAVYAPAGGRMDVWSTVPGNADGDGRPRSFFRFGSLQGAVRPLGVFAIKTRPDILSASGDGEGARLKSYSVKPGMQCSLVFLYSITDGELLAIINDGYLQEVRVGATAGIGAKYLAREDSRRIGILGSGRMARSYLEAIASVRPLRSARVYSPDQLRREGFAREMSERLAFEVTAVDCAEEAVRGADIVAVCTNSARPVIDGSWLEAGMHLTPVGANEMDQGSLGRIDVLVRHIEGGAEGYFAGTADAYTGPSGRFLERVYHGADRGDAPTLADLVTGRSPGRTDERQITCFYNLPGSGVQFAAIGLKVYELARKHGIGRELPMEWFLQGQAG